MTSRARSSRSKARDHRERGLRPVQIRLPNVQSPEFKAEAHRQSLAVAESPHAQKDQGFIDAISE